jgi:hypothetical protein
VLVEKLQVTRCPQQHLTARRIREFYMQMEMGWVGTRDNEPLYPNTPFQEWMKKMRAEDKDDLVKLMKMECRAFSAVLLEAVRNRLQPTWQHIQALELIDPMGPDLARFAKPPVWDALKDICSRRSLDFDKCRQQIIQERAKMPNLDDLTRGRVRNDLVGYCRKRREAALRS